MTSKKQTHAMVDLVKKTSQPAQYNILFEDNPPVKSDEFMASFIKDNDIKNTTAKGENIILLSTIIKFIHFSILYSLIEDGKIIISFFSFLF